MLDGSSVHKQSITTSHWFVVQAAMSSLWLVTLLDGLTIVDRRHRNASVAGGAWRNRAWAKS